MATDVILPALGMAQDTGKIVRWLKAEGDAVKQGEPIVEVETDKVTVELESPAAGTLAHISGAAGDDIPVGQVIAVILAAGETDATPVAAMVAAPAASDVAENGHLPLTSLSPTVPLVRGPHTRLASPKAKRIAAEHGLHIAAITGSGPHGEVLAADVLAVVASGSRAAPVAPAPVPSVAAVLPETSASISTAWRIMAERTTQSWTTVPHFFLLREVDATAFTQWHSQAQKHATEKLTFTDLFVKIVAAALRQHPRVNASWQNGAIAPNEAVNVGIAVAVADGLLVPVIQHADDLSLNAIARHRTDLVTRAQAGALRPGDLQGGTFTISNLGMYGIDSFTAIINPPQAAILAVGAVKDQVVPVNGQPAIRPMMRLSLSCDHRVIDGARGAQFLATVAELISDPSGL
jgi:pyruvate dehydrogenase E2 component (dihydrolipoamide acetyltransferase)